MGDQSRETPRVEESLRIGSWFANGRENGLVGSWHYLRPNTLTLDRQVNGIARSPACARFCACWRGDARLARFLTPVISSCCRLFRSPWAGEESVFLLSSVFRSCCCLPSGLWPVACGLSPVFFLLTSVSCLPPHVRRGGTPAFCSCCCRPSGLWPVTYPLVRSWFLILALLLSLPTANG